MYISTITVDNMSLMVSRDTASVDSVHCAIRLRHKDIPDLLPLRPGGTLAAIAACPDADVIFVAHAGLDNIVSAGDV